MGQILSSDTVYAVAYLTELGRNYLFDPAGSGRFQNGMDLFQIAYFSMSDPDVNYNLALLPESGDVPDVSGNNSTCVKGTIMNVEENLISYNGIISGVNGISAPSNQNLATYSVTTNANATNNILSFSIDSIPTI